MNQQNPKYYQLYRYFDKDGKLLYVGASQNAIQRLATHKHSSNFYSQIVDIKIENFTTKKQLSDAEHFAINNENPIYNIEKIQKLLGNKDCTEVQFEDSVPEQDHEVLVLSFDLLKQAKMNKHQAIKFREKMIAKGKAVRIGSQVIIS